MSQQQLTIQLTPCKKHVSKNLNDALGLPIASCPPFEFILKQHIFGIALSHAFYLDESDHVLTCFSVTELQQHQRHGKHQRQPLALPRQVRRVAHHEWLSWWDGKRCLLTAAMTMEVTVDARSSGGMMPFDGGARSVVTIAPLGTTPSGPTERWPGAESSELI